MRQYAAVVPVMLAALFTGALASRTFVEFERVRIPVVPEPVTARQPYVAVDLPDLRALGREPSALMIATQGARDPRWAGDGEIAIAVNGAPLGRARVAAGEEVEQHLTFVPPPGTSHQLVLTGPARGWVLTSIEISAARWERGTPFELVVVPEGRRHHRAAPPWVAAFAFVLLVVLGAAARPPARPVLRFVHTTALVVGVLPPAAALASPLLTGYSVLLSLETLLVCAALTYNRALIGAGSHAGRHAWRSLGRLRAEASLDPGLLPLPSAREIGAACAAFAVFTWIVLHRQVTALHSVPDLGDPLFSIWRLGWVGHQLFADPRHLFDANIFHPTRGTLTYSDSMILPALVHLPLVWAGLHPVAAYNLLFVSAFPLSGLTTYVFARSLGFGIPAAWTSGVIFGFSSFRFEHYSHLELQLTYWMPLALLGVHRLLLGSVHRGWVALVALSLGAQWYSSMYFGLFLTIYLAAFAAAYLLTLPRAHRPYRRVAGALALGCLLVVPLAAVYAAYTDERGERSVGEIAHYSATPADYLQSTDRRAIYGSVQWGRPRPERQLFPGVVPIVLGIAGAWPPLSATRLALCVAGIVAFDGSLGMNGLWYPVAHRVLAPLQSIRAPARFALLVGLTLALLSGAAVQRWMSRVRPVRPWIGALLLTIPLAVDVWPSLTLVRVWRRPSPTYEHLRRIPDAVLLEYPLNPAPEGFPDNLPFMYFSIWHWTPMVNGYSGHVPDSYVDMLGKLRDFPSGPTLTHARDLGVTHINVLCGIDGPFGAFSIPTRDSEKCRRTLEALDADPRVRAIVRAEWHAAPAVLYELVR